MSSRVVIWRLTWLPFSETFIRNHVNSLQAWEPVCVGVATKRSAIASPTDQVLYSASLLDRVLRQLLIKTGWSRRLEKFLAEGEFDLVHAHFGNDAVVVALACRRLGLPLIVTLHGIDVSSMANRSGLRGAIYRYRLRRTLQGAAAVIAVSDYIAQRALVLGATNGNTVVHYSGIPLSPLPHLITDPRFDVLFVGRLVEKKGVADLIRAVSIIQNKYAERVSVTIVGSGPLENALTSLAAEESVDALFLGARSSHDVAELMRRSKIIAVPSVTAADGDTEGLPTVICEAAAASRPVIGYAHSGIAEGVVHGETGLLCNEHDIEGLAENIHIALQDRHLRDELGKSARVRAEKLFDISKQVLRLEAIYNSAKSA